VAVRGFGVAVSSVVKWSPGKVADTASVPGRRRDCGSSTRIGQTRHLTLHGLKEELAARGVNVAHNAVWLFLRREGVAVQKKTLFALEQAPRRHRSQATTLALMAGPSRSAASGVHR